jgi:DNA-binding NarL/FixJ family response regulator
MDTIRVVLADDHAGIRQGIANLLRQAGDIEVVGQAQDGLEALSAVEELQPDVLLLDLSMPKMDGVDVARQLITSRFPVRILVLSIYLHDEYVQALCGNGICGYLTKDEDPEYIVQAVHRVAAGETGVYSKGILERISPPASAPQAFPTASIF